MGIFKIISVAIVLIIACVFIVIVVSYARHQDSDVSDHLRNTGEQLLPERIRAEPKKLSFNKAMITAAIIFLILAMVVNVANAYFRPVPDDDTSSSVTSSVVSEVSTSEGTAEDSGTAESGASGSMAETSGTAQAGESYAESTASTAEQ